MRASVLFLLLWVSVRTDTIAQNYHAIKGSSYFSALSVADNPASIKLSPHTWDLSLFAFQFQAFSNAFTPASSSLMKIPGRTKLTFTEGEFKRRSYFNTDVHLLNARFALNEKYAIGFGANFRGYAEVESSSFNYMDSLRGVEDFLNLNQNNVPYEATARNSSWLDIYGTIASTVRNDSRSTFNLGLTIKGSIGLSGAHASIQKVYASPISTLPGAQDMLLQNGVAEYGYSSHYEGWAEMNSVAGEVKEHLKNSLFGGAIDIGAEYLVKLQDVPTYEDVESSTKYSWKIGVALLDLGFNRYTYSGHSRRVSELSDEITAIDLETKFSNPADVVDFNDSLSSIVNNSERLQGTFKVINPARLSLNIDHNLGNNFFINGQLSLHLSELAAPGALNVTENQLLIVTPRYETLRFGLFMPVQYNRMQQVWIGGAIKAGPVLLGTHNLLSIFNQKKAFNGGAYLAVIFTSKREKQQRKRNQSDCPVLIW